MIEVNVRESHQHIFAEAQHGGDGAQGDDQAESEENEGQILEQDAQGVQERVLGRGHHAQERDETEQVDRVEPAWPVHSLVAGHAHHLDGVRPEHEAPQENLGAGVPPGQGSPHAGLGGGLLGAGAGAGAGLRWGCGGGRGPRGWLGSRCVPFLSPLLIRHSSYVLQRGGRSVRLFITCNAFMLLILNVKVDGTWNIFIF